MNRRLLIVYVLALHLLIGLLLWKSDFVPKIAKRLGVASTEDELTPHYYRMLAFHRRSIDIIPEGSILFIGDSLTQGLCVTAVSPNSVNFGIGSDTSVGVIDRLDDYEHAIEKASSVVLAIGTNDMRRRTDSELLQNYSVILDLIGDKPIFISSILPVDEKSLNNLTGRSERIASVNEALKQMANTRNNVTFVDNGSYLDSDGDGQLDRELHVGDGIHLNSQGNLKWAQSLKHGIGG